MKVMVKLTGIVYSEHFLRTGFIDIYDFHLGIYMIEARIDNQVIHKKLIKN